MASPEELKKKIESGEVPHPDKKGDREPTMDDLTPFLPKDFFRSNMMGGIPMVDASVLRKAGIKTGGGYHNLKVDASKLEQSGIGMQKTDDIINEAKKKWKAARDRARRGLFPEQK